MILFKRYNFYLKFENALLKIFCIQVNMAKHVSAQVGYRIHTIPRFDHLEYLIQI